MKRLLSNWNIQYEHIIEVQKDVWRIDESYFLKADDHIRWIRNLQLYSKLRQMGIPAPEVVCTIKGEDYLAYKDKYYFLTRKLEGIHLSKEEVVNNPEVAHMVGQVIAKLHNSFSEISDAYKLEEQNFVDELKGWIKSNLDKFAVDSFTYNIFNDCLCELNLVYGSLERHLIHRDMHLGNFIFADHKITGYIDFDLTQVNARIFDIAYLIVGWIVGEVNDEKYMENWKQSIEFVLKGYQQEQNQKLSETELNAIVIMMCCIEILFVAYFYSINDSNNYLKAEECLKWLWKNRKGIL